MYLRHALACAAALATAGQAQALSCMVPDTAVTYMRAAEAAEVYVVLHGTLTFDQQAMPGAIEEDGDVTIPIPAHFSGALLGPQGFDGAHEIDLMLNVNCWSPWCGNANTGEPYIVFARQAEDGSLSVPINPCADLLFFRPTEAQISAVERCHSGGQCEPGDGSY